tara:strand:+ start:4272 stop:4478 length:207 start_codon:yes stop_codon:yes gene_type:complete
MNPPDDVIGKLIKIDGEMAIIVNKQYSVSKGWLISLSWIGSHMPANSVWHWPTVSKFLFDNLLDKCSE